jgi:hypothetical protein
MKKLILRLFQVALILFSVMVELLVLSLTMDEEDVKLLGYGYNYYLIPLLLINLLIVFIYSRKIHFSGIKLIIFMWLVLIPFPILLAGQPFATNIIKVALWPTSFFASYLLVRSNPKAKQTLISTFIVIFLIGVYFFIQSKTFQSVSIRLGIMGTSNAIFGILTILPWILLLKNKKYIFILFLVLFGAVIFSNKRSATLILAGASIPFLNSLLMGVHSKVSRWLILLLVGVTLLGGFYYVSDVYLEGRIFTRFESIGEDEGSHRLTNWRGVIKSLERSYISELMVGNGHYAVGLKDATGRGSSAAHNDFLDVLYDYGLFMFLLYILLHIKILQRSYYLYKSRSPLFNSYFSSWVIFIVMSTISILIVQPRYLIFFAVYWGMVEAILDNQMVKLNSKFSFKNGEICFVEKN